MIVNTWIILGSCFKYLRRINYLSIKTNLSFGWGRWRSVVISSLVSELRLIQRKLRMWWIVLGHWLQRILRVSSVVRVIIRGLRIVLLPFFLPWLYWRKRVWNFCNNPKPKKSKKSIFKKSTTHGLSFLTVDEIIDSQELSQENLAKSWSMDGPTVCRSVDILWPQIESPFTYSLTRATDDQHGS